MKTIFKYPVELTDYFQIQMPDCAEVLSVQVQNGRPYIWALVEMDYAPRNYNFRLAGTGHPIEEDNLKFIGTFQIASGTLVFHLFLDD